MLGAQSTTSNKGKPSAFCDFSLAAFVDFSCILLKQSTGETVGSLLW